MDAEVINLSWPADDNNIILNRTINFITNNYIAKGLSTDNLFVIIGWSSPERNSFWYKDEDISMEFRLWPQVAHFNTDIQKDIWKLYVSHLWNAEEYIPRYVRNVTYLQNFCDAYNIKWMCFNSFYQVPGKSIQDWHDLDISDELSKLTNKLAGYQYQSSTNGLQRDTMQIDYKPLWDLVDPVRFYKKDQSGNTFRSYIENPKNKITPVFNGWHPSPESHEAWAEELANYIRSNNLL
jgi:hypothetical protein